ncbi:hypothetical protein TNCV_1621501 [Trichonephila clavipes]|nr:hypothetical protein TNCV_1621501 [Trichonephila clavipes]
MATGSYLTPTYSRSQSASTPLHDGSLVAPGHKDLTKIMTTMSSRPEPLGYHCNFMKLREEEKRCEDP